MSFQRLLAGSLGLVSTAHRCLYLRTDTHEREEETRVFMNSMQQGGQRATESFDDRRNENIQMEVKAKYDKQKALMLLKGVCVFITSLFRSYDKQKALMPLKVFVFL